MIETSRGEQDSISATPTGRRWNRCRGDPQAARRHPQHLRLRPWQVPPQSGGYRPTDGLAEHSRFDSSGTIPPDARCIDCRQVEQISIDHQDYRGHQNELRNHSGDRMKPLIQKLVETQGPSGYETQIRSVVRAEIEPYADDLKVDALGNLIVRKGKGAEEGIKIMLVAHIDEIGVMVTQVDANGFVRFTTLGGVRPYTCVGGRVRFLNGAAGVINMEPLDDMSRMPTFEQLYIDMGCSSSEATPVRVGDVATFDRPFLDLGGRLVAKSLDDRIGVAVMIETLRQIKATPHQLYFVFSTQEEVGVRGATTAAFGIDPDLGVAVDVTGTGDTPRRTKVRMDVSLGKGPAIKVRDGGMLADRRVVDWMVKCAEQLSLPYQMEILEGGSTDARAMQLTRAGIPAGCLSIPCRYIHSPSEMVDFADVQNAVTLLIELVSHPVKL